MRKATVLLLTLFMFLAWAGVSAQEKPGSQPSANTSGEARTSLNFYRLDFTIRELQDKKVIAVRYYSMLLADDGIGASLKSGARLPVVTGSSSGAAPSTLVSTQFQYIDVGVNLRCRIKAGEPPLLVTTVEFSSPALPEQQGEPGSPSLAKGQPVIRQATSEAYAPLQPGKALLLASMDDPSSPRRFEIEVTPTRLK